MSTDRRARSIEIPVRGSNEVVEVLTDELPEDAYEIEAILCGEQAPLDLFPIFALEYYHRGRFDALEKLLKAGLAECHRRTDRRALLVIASTLAAYYISEALKLLTSPLSIKEKSDTFSSTTTSTTSTASSKIQIEKYFEEATSLLNEAERYQSGQGPEVNLLLRKGLLLLVQGRPSAAEYQLNVVLNKEPDNVIARAALGAVAFCLAQERGDKEDWSVAKKHWQALLRTLGTATPPFIKFLIAHCFWREGRISVARQCFERLLEETSMESSLQVQILVSLAGLLLCSSQSDDLTRAMHLYKDAYERDRTHPLALYHLANHFFFKSDYSKSEILARSALNQLTTMNAIEEKNLTGGIAGLIGDVHYLLGKINHKQGRWQEAMLEYTEAAKANHTLLMVQLALGQVALHLGEQSLARECLERVAQGTGSILEEDGEFWTMVGCLTGQQTYLEKALHIVGDNIYQGSFTFDLFIALARSCKGENPSQALQYYRRAWLIDEGRFRSNFALLHNFAIILYLASTRNGDANVMDSEKDVERILEECEGLARGHSALLTLVKFNRARMWEDLARRTGDSSILGRAETLYKELAENDATAHLRLGIICTKRNQSTEASEHFKEAIGHDTTNADMTTMKATTSQSIPLPLSSSVEVDAWLLLARNQLLSKALTPARKAFERILRTHDRHDPFALLALGSIYVDLARVEKNPETRKEYLRRSLEFYVKVLSLPDERHRRNWVAAQGVGVTLAELGRYHEAKEVFLQTRQGLDQDGLLKDHPEVLLNLGHCWVELGQWSAAISTFEQAMNFSSSGSRRAALHLYMARAWYAQAKEERSLEAFDRAIEALERAAQLLPDDTPIKFNIALAKQEVAATLLRRSKSGTLMGGGGGSGSNGGEKIELEELERALQLVEKAHALFAILQAKDIEQSSSNSEINPVIIEQRAKYCQSLQTMLEERRGILKSQYQQWARQLETVKQEREQYRQAERARQEEAEQQRREEEARRQVISQEMAAKLRQTEELIQAVDEADSSEGESDNMDGNRQKKSKREGVKRERDAKKESGVKQRSSRRKRMEQEQKGMEDELSRGDYLSKEFISSDTEEE